MPPDAERRPPARSGARTEPSPGPRISRAADRAPATREVQLKKALAAARIPHRDSRIYTVLLLRRMQWKTGEIPDRFQPRSIAELAGLCGMSESTTLRGLSGLENNGWIIRERKPVRGRGHKTTYQLDTGRDYPPKSAAEPKTGAERTRKWRQKMRQGNVTADASKVLHSDVTPPEDIRQFCVTEYVTSRHTSPGQGQESAKEGRDEGEIVRDPPKLRHCTVCHRLMDPVLPAFGYTTHPNCDEDDQGDGTFSPAEQGEQAFQPELAA
jgi:hypothetical protein